MGKLVLGLVKTSCSAKHLQNVQQDLKRVETFNNGF